MYQFGCGILKMVGPKQQHFWPKINKLKGNHCILRIWGAPARQKLGMILENKVPKKFLTNHNSSQDYFLNNFLVDKERFDKE